MPHPPPAGDLLAMGTAAGRWAVAATVCGSAVAIVAGTVVNVALPDIAAGLDASTAGVQWVLNSYLLALASLILIGGALGDLHGRRRVFVIGTAVFGAASLAAAAAPTLGWLLAARAAMGVGGALLTPGSLAILESGFRREDRAAAIGAWSGLGGVAAAVGPLAGGLLLDAAGWRALFVLNVPLCALAIGLALRHLPESRDPGAAGQRLDLPGTVTAVLGLGLLTYGLIALGGGGGGVAVTTILVGAAVLVAFVVVERRVRAPLVPVDMFADRTFAVANLMTFVVYAALGGVFFLLVVFLRLVLGYSGVQAGAATLPMTALMLLLSARSGRMAARIGPRLPLTAGPLLLAGAMLGYSRLDADAGYATAVLPAVVAFGLGLVLLIAPVTATVLGAADPDRAGVASGINNAVARTAGLLAVAVLPAAAGLGPTAFDDPTSFAAGFSRAMLLTAGLAVAGAVIAFLGLPARATAPRGAAAPPVAEPHLHCDLQAPPATVGRAPAGS